MVSFIVFASSSEIGYCLLNGIAAAVAAAAAAAADTLFLCPMAVHSIH